MARPFDGHVHVGAWRLPDFAGRRTDPADLLALYQRWAYAGALVFTTDSGDNRWLLDALPRRSGELELRHAYWVAPEAPGNLAFLEETAESWAALKIHPSLLRRPLSDPAFVPFLGLAAELAIPVVVHCGRWTEIAGFGIALDVAASAPDVRFILGHLGGDSPRLVDCCTARVAAEDPPNVFLGTESIREPWLLELALERIGPARLVFGSDYNLNHPEPFRRLVEILDLADADRELILAGNIDGLFPPRHRFGRTAVAPHGVEP